MIQKKGGNSGRFLIESAQFYADIKEGIARFRDTYAFGSWFKTDLTGLINLRTQLCSLQSEMTPRSPKRDQASKAFHLEGSCGSSLWQQTASTSPVDLLRIHEYARLP
jgi:hypothetical protein